MAVRGRLGKDAADSLRGHDAPHHRLSKLVHGTPRVSRRLARALILVAGCVSLALPATAATASTGPQVTPGGRVASPATGGSEGYLESDSCTSRVFCMAVGGYTRSGHLSALSATFSGGGWVAEPVPSPSQGVNVFANEVSCASRSSCLFVGDHWAGKHGPAANLAEAWDGSSWRIVATVSPAGSSYSYLNDVACPTTRFCLVVGSAGTSRTHYKDMAYIWDNGSTWRRITVPRPSRARNSELGALDCSSAKSCMAVGNYTSASGHDLGFAARWHDGKWNLLTTPAVPRQRWADFQAISCAAATRCVAVGVSEDDTRAGYYHAFAETWSGGKWHVSMVRRAPSYFFGTSCPAQNRCFATGITFPSRRAYEHPLIETWNGRSWTTQRPVSTTAPYRGDFFEHVSCANRSSCEAVGGSFDPSNYNKEQTLAEAWNGHHWTLQTTPNP